MKATIRRVAPLSLGRMGCLLGLVAAFLPSVTCGVLAVGGALLVQRWLESWQNYSISILGNEVANIDFVRLLQLQGVLDVLHAITGASGLALVLAILALALAAGALLALLTMLVGLSYNALAAVTGGVVIDIDTIRPFE